jgi:hypothetical protein
MKTMSQPVQENVRKSCLREIEPGAWEFRQHAPSRVSPRTENPQPQASQEQKRREGTAAWSNAGEPLSPLFARVLFELKDKKPRHQK